MLLGVMTAWLEGITCLGPLELCVLAVDELIIPSYYSQGLCAAFEVMV